jgi:oligoendopeptidase F
MSKRAESDDERLFYLGSALEGMRGTFFRQTMFAEFELSLYEAVERGEALSGERISEIYGEILKRYHGHDDGVVVIDELYTNEWMFIPHFYFNMYVYQYATSKTAGTALYAKIVEEGEPGVENYKNLLRAGGSDYPYTLLSNAGVDMAQPGPYRAVATRFSECSKIARWGGLLQDSRNVRKSPAGAGSYGTNEGSVGARPSGRFIRG